MDKICIYISHQQRLISCTPLAQGQAQVFSDYNELFAFCQPLLQQGYGLQ
ncbi:MAG: hypothetical protein IJR17_00800 [Clostridia bacterium]|nr:hypothetical protein [Clostridia bacterium]